MIVIFILGISLQITPDTATIGDSLTVFIMGDVRDSISIIPPDSFPDIFIIDSLKRESDTLRKIYFTSFSIGAQDFKIRIGKDTMRVNYYIESVLSARNKGLSPIWGPYPFFNWHYLLWLFILPFGFLAYYLLRRRRREEIFAKEPEKEPGEEAFGNLAILEEKIEEWDWNRIYTGLSYIVRRYIERTTGIPAVETTTYELTRLFKQEKKKDLKPLIDRFPRWDLIKFADRESSMEEVKNDIETTRKVIKEIEKDDTFS